jgi:hypothetical protein
MTTPDPTSGHPKSCVCAACCSKRGGKHPSQVKVGRSTRRNDLIAAAIAAVVLFLIVGSQLSGGGHAQAAGRSLRSEGDAATPSTATTRHKHAKHHHADTAAARTGHARLCIYPGAGERRLISPLPGPTPPADWASACAANGGYPVQRWGSGLYLEPRNGLVYKSVSGDASTGLVVAPQ